MDTICFSSPMGLVSREISAYMLMSTTNTVFHVTCNLVPINQLLIIQTILVVGLESVKRCT